MIADCILFERKKKYEQMIQTEQQILKKSKPSVCTWSPEKFSKNFWVTLTSPRAWL